LDFRQNCGTPLAIWNWEQTSGRIADELFGGCEVFDNRRGCKLSSRLIEVRNWPELAQATNYSAALLSQRCQISTRQLERFFLKNVGESPHHWLHHHRMKRALELLRSGCSVKEVALTLGYRTIAHFSREFKRWHGFPPSHHRLREILPPSP